MELLLRNARQIQSVVDATFSPPLLEERSHQLECQSVDTDLDRLACDWKEVSDMLGSHAGNRSADLLGKLMKVCCRYRPTLASPTN